MPWFAEVLDDGSVRIDGGRHRRMMADQRAGGELDSVERAVSFIATHYDRPLDVAWLAAKARFCSRARADRLPARETP